MSINIDSFRAIALNANLDYNAEIGVADDAKTKIGIQGAKPLALRAISVPNELERQQNSIYLRSQLLSAIRDAVQGSPKADEIFQKAEAQLFGAVDGKTGQLNADLAVKPLTVRDVRAVLDNVNDWGLKSGVDFTKFCEANPAVTALPKWVSELPVNPDNLQGPFNNLAYSHAREVLRHQGLRMTPESLPKIFEHARCILETIKNHCGDDRDLQEIVFANLGHLTVNAESKFRGMDVIEAKIANFKAMLDLGRTYQNGIYLKAIKGFMIDSGMTLKLEDIQNLVKITDGVFDAKIFKPKASMQTMHTAILKFAKMMSEPTSPLNRAYVKCCPGGGGDGAGAFFQLSAMLALAKSTPAQRKALHDNLKAHALPLRALYRRAQLRYELRVDLDMKKLGVFLGLNNVSNMLDAVMKCYGETFGPSSDDNQVDAKAKCLYRDEIDLAKKDLEELCITNDAFFAKRNG